MHNLDSFLQHVEDDLAAPQTPTPVATAPTTAAAKGKGKKGAAAKEVAVVSSQESEEVPASLLQSANKLNGGVNFVLGDIDTANSLVSHHFFLVDLLECEPLIAILFMIV